MALADGRLAMDEFTHQGAPDNAIGPARGNCSERVGRGQMRYPYDTAQRDSALSTLVFPAIQLGYRSALYPAARKRALRRHARNIRVGVTFQATGCPSFMMTLPSDAAPSLPRSRLSFHLRYLLADLD